MTPTAITNPKLTDAQRRELEATLAPFPGYAFVRRDRVPTQTAGGLVLPEAYRSTQEIPRKATVLSAGGPAFDGWGNATDCPATPGSRVWLDYHKGKPVHLEGQHPDDYYMLAPFEALLARVEG